MSAQKKNWHVMPTAEETELSFAALISANTLIMPLKNIKAQSAKKRSMIIGNVMKNIRPIITPKKKTKAYAGMCIALIISAVFSNFFASCFLEVAIKTILRIKERAAQARQAAMKSVSTGSSVKFPNPNA